MLLLTCRHVYIIELKPNLCNSINNTEPVQNLRTSSCSVSVVVVYTAGSHHGDRAGGSQRSEGQSHRGVCSCSTFLQGTCPKGTSLSSSPSFCWFVFEAHIFIGFSLLSWLIFILGSEGPVLISAGRRGDKMGDHCPCCVETACETVHEGGCILGKDTWSPAGGLNDQTTPQDATI